MNDKINNLKDKIQQLINNSVEANNHHKTLLNFLFKKLDEVKELETLEYWKDYEGGKYLKALLLYRSVIRANFQQEHLKLTNFEDGERYLEAISRDIEEMEKGQNEPKQPNDSQRSKELTNQQLLILLGERIEKGEIRGDWEKWSWTDGPPLFNCLFLKDENDKKILSVSLDTGKIKPDPAQQFLKKHGIKGKK
jgi:hypothetical protein